MASPDFPLEIWLNILERACQDDGTTGLSLSMTSQEMRLISRPYRYQSVQIKGWKQLLLFEERFSQLPKEEQQLVNLFVDMEDVFEVGYPGAPLLAPEDSDPDDASYVPSDDEPEDLADLRDLDGLESLWRDGDDGEQPTDEDVESEAWDTEDEIEFTSPSTSEQLELDDDWEFLLPGVRRLPHTLFQGGPSPVVTLEDLQQNVSNESIQAEGFGYAALHRVLKAGAGSLEIFTLRWSPRNGFSGGEFFPILPRLRSLVIWKFGAELRVTEPLPGSGWFVNDARLWGIPKEPTRFPSLKRLECNYPAHGTWFKPKDIDVLYNSASCSVLRYGRPGTSKRMRICCLCSASRCSQRPESPKSFQVDSIDFKQEWVDQALQCSVTPGFQNGSFPVMVIAWVKDTLEYHDAVLITDETGCIRLWDHIHQLEPRGIHSKHSLELYEPKREAWHPVTWRETLGPATGTGFAFLLREAGTLTMRRFDRFASMACSSSPVRQEA